MTEQTQHTTVPAPRTAPPGPAVPTGLPRAASPPRLHRRRRPTGAPPPLPHPFTISTSVWLVLAVAVLIGTFALSARTSWHGMGERIDTWFLLQLAEFRTPWLTRALTAVNTLGAGWGATVIGLAVVGATMAFRRWRHLWVFMGSLVLLQLVGRLIYFGVSRPRPFGITTIGHWGGYSAPSPPVAVLTVFLVGAVYCLVVPGRPRTLAKVAIAAVIAVMALSRLYLAVDHPSDVLLGVALGVAIPVTAFRFYTPNEIFPVVYRRGRTAHVDVSGRRGEGIRTALRDQLGMTVTEVKPVGLESSAGSTPLRLRLVDGPEEYLFAKLYTRGHVRADRWYKLGRTILYGTLEDETPFQTVRRLAEYEDYTLRLLRDVGVRTAKSYGIVEITPEREYLLVTEFFQDAVEIGDAVVDDAVIDQGLQLVRRLWDAGIAHRDIKPGNLMVREGELLLIDVAFAQVRPSPWRQAVDLGNMMLVLAVRSEPERVYARALEYFTPDELAEAFAATRGVASPTQLRAFMKRYPRDVLAVFRSLAPARKPIVLQRWSVRRVRLACTVLGAALLAVLVGQSAFSPLEDPSTFAPECDTGNSAVLAAQAVPSAAQVPCVAELPSGWQVSTADISRGSSTFWLNSDQAGTQAVTVTLTETCDITGAHEIPSDEPGTRRYEHPVSLSPNYLSWRYYTFPGGCAAMRFDFDPGTSGLLAIPIDSAVGFVPRARLVDHVRSTDDLALCGRGAPCPG